MLQELELTRHSLFLKDKELELLQKKAEGAIELKEQVLWDYSWLVRWCYDSELGSTFLYFTEDGL